MPRTNTTAEQEAKGRPRFSGSSINRVILVGNLVRDADLIATQGKPMTRLRVATSTSWRDREGNRQEATEFHSVVAFGRLAEVAGAYCIKGRRVYVEGRLRTRDYTLASGERRYVTEVVADIIKLLSPRGGGEGGSTPSDSDEAVPSADQPVTADAPSGEAETPPLPGTSTEGSGRLHCHVLAQARRTVEVIDLVRRLDEQQRAPLAEETALLASWRGWGTMAAAFSGRGAGDAQWAEIRAAVEQRLNPTELAAAIGGSTTSYFTDPRLVHPVWRLAIELGFAGGRVLETGCGTGAFMAATPAGVAVRWVGVEPDWMAARIAALRFPGAEIVPKELQDVRLADGSYDLAIGNVSFSNPDTHNLVRCRGLSLHNYCLWRALKALRPGGLVVAITSRYTLDASSPHQRDRLAELGDLVGAIRLRSGAFRASGTGVVTDIVAFRRREPGTAMMGSPWRAVTTAMVREVPVNEYFARRPELVLGRPMVRPGLYHPELAVEPTGSLVAALGRATRDVIATAGVASLRRSEP